jgi:acetyl esterase/lipase
MLHGGGYVTLSRKAVRSHQTQDLLDNGILPVSLDYRLCPEITVVEGPLEDMRDALIWAREHLPALAEQRGVLVNAEKLCVIGWFTGGHLAMTSAWISYKSGIAPPKAILSFYAPTDFESECETTIQLPSGFQYANYASTDFTTRQGDEYPERSLPMEVIGKALSNKVASNLFFLPHR